MLALRLNLKTPVHNSSKLYVLWAWSLTTQTWLSLLDHGQGMHGNVFSKTISPGPNLEKCHNLTPLMKSFLWTDSSFTTPFEFRTTFVLSCDVIRKINWPSLNKSPTKLHWMLVKILELFITFKRQSCQNSPHVSLSSQDYTAPSVALKWLTFRRQPPLYKNWYYTTAR